MKHKNRESWLRACMVQADKDLFSKIPGIKVNLNKIAITCGYAPGYRESQKAKGTDQAGRYSVLGVCYDQNLTGKAEIFIFPDGNHNGNMLNLVNTVVHEMIHAIIGNIHGHGAEFGRVARAIGYRGKMRSTPLNKTVTPKFNKIIKKIGKYPSKQFLPRTKKQSTRMLKLVCPAVARDCGAIIRMSGAQINNGAPICRCYDEKIDTPRAYQMIEE